MNKLVRAFLALATFALSSALFAGSADVYVDSGQTFYLTVNGTGDSDITIVNLDTNQTVASISALTTNGSTYSYSYWYYGSTASGVTLTDQSHAYATVTGLTAGNYRVTATSSQLTDFSSNSWGNSAEIDLWDPYSGWGWMDINVSIQ
ncbi:hypothetical protein [Nibricoccus aquaticus]|nr:hypothetical protein [Nibricoccus aquaticus]